MLIAVRRGDGERPGVVQQWGQLVEGDPLDVSGGIRLPVEAGLLSGEVVFCGWDGVVEGVKLGFV